MSSVGGSATQLVVPAEALVLGRRDALVVLGLRVLRRVALVLIPVGATLALLGGSSQDRLNAELDTVSEWWHSLVSPWWLFTIGVLLRLTVVPAAYLAALGAAVLGPRQVRAEPDARTAWSRLGDTFRVAGGLRALRWTDAARDVAVGLRGSYGVLLRRLEVVLGWLLVAAWVLLVVVIGVRAG